jgi:hypothetical protein
MSALMKQCVHSSMQISMTNEAQRVVQLCAYSSLSSIIRIQNMYEQYSATTMVTRVYNVSIVCCAYLLFVLCFHFTNSAAILDTN